jgi:hypothetical protein
MTYKFIENTNSRKVGAMATSYSPRQTCPDTCPLKNGKCYGENFPIKLHWDRYSNDKNDNYNKFIDEIKLYRKYTPTKLWRHNIVGDLVVDKDFKIHAKKLNQLINANNKGSVICYTHHHTIKDKKGKNKLSRYNLNRIKEANQKGFTINLSTDSIEQGKELFKKTKLPTVTTLKTTKNQYKKLSDNEKKEYKKELLKDNIVICPEQTNNIKCLDCKLCSRSDRKTIIGFLEH